LCAVALTDHLRLTSLCLTMEVTEHELRVMCIVIRMSISIRVMLFPDLMSIKHPFCTCILLSLISSIIGVWIHSLSEMTVRYVMIVDVLWRYGMFIISWLYCKTTGAFTGQVQNSSHRSCTRIACIHTTCVC
jgi:hypothetical protein